MKTCHIKYSIVALLCVLFIPFFVTADDNSIEHGMYSMQFQISDFLRFNDLHGMMLSGKYHFSDRSAIRLGFDATLRSATEERQSSREDWNGDLDIDIAVQFESKMDTYTFDVFGQYMGYARKSSKVFVYYGIGPIVRFGRSVTEERSHSWGELHTDSEARNRSIGGGIIGTIGVEWFATSVISFIAEYGAEAMYTRSKYDSSQNRYVQEDTIIQERTSEVYNLRRRSVKFGLSIYF